MMYLGNNLFDDVFNTCFRSDLRSDVSFENDTYEVTVDVPGVDKKNIEIKFDDDVLTVNVKAEKKNAKKEYLVKERFNYQTSRTYYLEDGNPDSIKAKLENGVLTITVSKMPKVETKKLIAIE